MGGFFGLASREDCIVDLFYGTDYHSHLGTKRGGLCIVRDGRFSRAIHNIENVPFRSKFDDEVSRLHANFGIGVISDTDDQPLLIRSHLGDFAIATVGAVKNTIELAAEAFRDRRLHFSEMSGGEINPTELVATLINQGETFEEGIANAQNAIRGSCSLLVLTAKGIYAARDAKGRTPVIIGKTDSGMAVTMETCAFPNLGIEYVRDLGPGEIVFLTPDGCETRKAPGDVLQICSFLWVYYGYPASSYEGIPVESVRYRCGSALAHRYPAGVDFVSGIPDSGVGHALGFAAESRLPFRRPFVKYTPTWARSFMPQNQAIRDLVARMKLIPVRDLVKGKKILFCDDSIVRGTQLQDTIKRLFAVGAEEVHMRPACPPLLHGCQFLNFSVSRTEDALAARRAVRKIAGESDVDLDRFSEPDSPEYAAMEEEIRMMLNLTSLKYQRLDDLIAAIGLPKEKLCTFCWNGKTR